MQFLVKDSKDPKFERIESANHPAAIIEGYKAAGREVTVIPIEGGEERDAIAAPQGNGPPADIASMIAAQRAQVMQTGQKVDPWEGMVNAVLAKKGGIVPPAQMLMPQVQVQQVQVQKGPPDGEFEVGGVKVKLSNGKLFKQEWVLADQTVHRVKENNFIEELQWIEVEPK